MPGKARARKAKRRRPQITICNRQKAVAVSPARLRRLIEFVARAEGQAVGAVDLAVVGCRQMGGLNRRYLGRPGATDVLSFDLSDADAIGIAAQLVVCGELAAARGPAHGYPPEQELMLYVIHGLLHLMGYHDGAVRAAAGMHAREEQLLAEFLARGGRKQS